MKRKEEKRKVGRPKLADTKIKKESLIVSGLCIVTIFTILFTGLYDLYIINYNKVKGNVIEYKTYEVGEEFCLGEGDCYNVVSDNYTTVLALPQNVISKDGEEIFFEYTTANINSYNEYYMNYLTNKYNLSNITVSLLPIGKAEKLGCGQQYRSCSSAPSWLTSTGRFWILGSMNNYYIDGTIMRDTYGYSDSRSYYRPMVIFKKSEFSPIVDQYARKYEIGKEVCIESECFYVMGEDRNKVYTIAKYSLNSNENAQNETDYDIITFSETYYWSAGYTSPPKPQYGDKYPAYVYDDNSALYPIINNYRDLLLEKSPNVEVMVPSIEILMRFGCDLERKTCADAPEFMYSISYWTGTANDPAGGMYQVGSHIYNQNQTAFEAIRPGSKSSVRPIVIFLQDDFKEMFGEPEPEEDVSKEKPETNVSTTKVGVETTAKTETKKTTEDNNIYLTGNEVSEETLKEVKGTNRNIIVKQDGFTLTINGKDIENIDGDLNLKVTSNILEASNLKEELKDKVKDGVVLSFEGEGKLPGKVKVTMKVTNDMKEKLGTENIKSYLYNDEVFNLIADDLSIKNNKVSFYIDRLGNYVLTKDKVNEKIYDDTALIKSNKNMNTKVEKSNKLPLVLGIVFISVATIGIVGIVIYNNNKTTKKKKVSKKSK